ncbi:MAG: PIN domain-containing protein [Bacillota bacterium]
MAVDVWVDANVILRYLLRDHEELFAEASRVMAAAERGEVNLHLASLTVAELIWVLDSFYGYSREEVAKVVESFATADGVIPEEREIILQALSDYAALNVDFIDAYLAAKASAGGRPVCTFDTKDFTRLPVERFSL